MAENIISGWHKGHEGPASDPEYQQNYGEKMPPLRSYGNLTYNQFINLTKYIWEKAHPENLLVPYGNRDKYDPEKGYMVYSLEQKKPKDNDVKPRHRHDVVKTDTGEFEAAIYTQSFGHLIEFTAVHKDPTTAELLLEAFEDFMTVFTKVVMSHGVENVFYNRRLSDKDMTRYGDDVAARSVIYFVLLQKILVATPAIVESITLDVRTFMNQNPPSAEDVLMFEID